MNGLAILLKGTLLTLEISACSLLIGFFMGALLGILSCERIAIKGLSAFIKGYVAILRGTPVFVQLLLAYFALPAALGFDISALSAGILTLGLNSTAYVAEIIRSGMNGIPAGQWDAAHTLGYSRLQMITSIIFPQALKKTVPALTNELIALIKESSLLMIIGVSELTKVSKEIVARELNPMQTYLMTALIYFILTTLIAKVAKKWEGGVHDAH